MKYLSATQVLFIHSRVIQETGGTEGVLDMGLLLSAVARPQASFDGKDLYTDLFSKAAALLESLARNHALVDGNKRTATVAMGLFLEFNGSRLSATAHDLEGFVLQVAQGNYSFNSVVDWIKSHSESE
jgi:death on curing protein